MTVLVMVSYSLVRPVTSAVTSWGGPGGPYRRCDGGSPFMELTVGARWAIFSSLHCCKKLLRSGALLQTIQMKSMIGTGPWFSRWARRDPSGSPARLLGSTGSSRQETPTRGSLPGGGGHTRVSTPETTVWPPASEEPVSLSASTWGATETNRSRFQGHIQHFLSRGGQPNGRLVGPWLNLLLSKF